MKEIYEKLLENLVSMTSEEKEKELEEFKKHNEIGPSVEEILNINSAEERIAKINDSFPYPHA